ncbi:zinc finger protein OZF isoform X6 [Cricetulus griseus]|uniref:Zinc finger protein OZF isoform X6 n=1 Tax=Cricetulus griseus TaxID=10029 RepID=A0A9J7H5G6_CRIGR|nr:zinc finger protein OZF isoform X6 [Cricetulus griseus]
MPHGKCSPRRGVGGISAQSGKPRGTEKRSAMPHGKCSPRCVGENTIRAREPKKRSALPRGKCSPRRDVGEAADKYIEPQQDLGEQT